MKVYPDMMILLLLTVIWLIYCVIVLEQHSLRNDWNTRMKHHQRVIIFVGIPVFFCTWFWALATVYLHPFWW